jgi:hypothetical protein
MRHINFPFFGLIIAASTVLGLPSGAIAAEWTKVTENAVGDRFLIDTSAIQRKDMTVFYWEYREFAEPNNAFVEVELAQPMYGAVSRWSVDCGTKNGPKKQYIRRVNTYAKDRSLIQKFSYGDPGLLVQSRSGSSAASVAEFACAYKAKP